LDVTGEVILGICKRSGDKEAHERDKPLSLSRAQCKRY